MELSLSLPLLIDGSHLMGGSLKIVTYEGAKIILRLISRGLVPPFGMFLTKGKGFINR
jgi:hypothetical protein